MKFGKKLLSRSRKCSHRNFERLFARVFIALGAAFWGAAALGLNPFGPREIPPWAAFAFCVGILGVGWFFERLAAVLLGVAAAAIVAWGVAVGWWATGGAMQWWTMTAMFIAPLAIAAVLFLLAARMQRLCLLEEAREAKAAAEPAPEEPAEEEPAAAEPAPEEPAAEESASEE